VVRVEKRNVRKEKDRAAEIWRRIEKMGKDERGCGILPLRECKELRLSNITSAMSSANSLFITFSL